MTQARTYARRARGLRTVRAPRPPALTFLETLSDEDLDALRTRGAPRAYGARATIFREREPADSVTVLLEGRAKLTVAAHGREVLLAVCGPGDLLEALAASGARVHATTATALEPVTALAVPAAEFGSLLGERPHLGVLVLRELGRRIADCERRRVEFASLDTVGRLASCLLELADRFGERTNGQVNIDLRLSQDELAGFAGASQKAATTALQSLRELGCIETGRRSITVRDIEALRRWAA